MDLTDASQLARRSTTLTFSLACIALVAYLLGHTIYNLFFHPLRRYPGPFLCRISKLPWV